MKKIKKYKYHILSFVIPFIICIIFLSLKGIFKNIELFLISDLRCQHLPFLNYLKSVMLGKDSIYYSYTAGMGSPMISTLVFYAISPINILLIIIKDIRYAILFIYIIKICLSGLTMYIYLKNKFNKEKFITVIFSTCYALSSYVINFSLSIFWFDSIYLAPLVLLGIDKIFDKEKINLLYIFSLSLAIICNIQIGFGLCIFSVLYFIYSYNIKYNIKKDIKKLKKLSLIFFISSLCAGAISSGFLLAFINDYKLISTARNIGLEYNLQTSGIDYILKNLFSVGRKKTDYFNIYEPYIYCGLIITILSILYLFNNNINKKKRRHTLILILIFIISFCIKPLNIFWHLTEPIYLNYRYSIYLSLFLTIIAYEYYITQNDLNKKDIKIIIISSLIGIIINIIYIKEVNIIPTILFIILINSLLILTKKINLNFEYLLSTIIIIELIVNSYLSFYSVKQLPFDHYSTYSSFSNLFKINKFDLDYRVTTDYTYTETLNDGMLINKNSSLRYFSSILSGNIINFLYKNASTEGKNSYTVSSYTSPILLSLLGNKYFYILDDIDSGIYKKKNTYKVKSYNYKKGKKITKKVFLYENPYALSLGYLINSDINYDDNYDIIDYQNNIIKALSGNNKDVIKRLEFGINHYNNYCNNSTYKNCKEYYIENNTTNPYVYFYAPFTLAQTDKDKKIYGDYSKIYLLKSKENDYNITIIPDVAHNPKSIRAYTYDIDVLKESLSKLQENMLTNVKINKNILTAKINSNKEGILFLSIPYDKRFKIYVDGKKTKYYPLLDNTFIGLNIKEGKHNIKLINKDDNLKWYISSSLFSLLITIILYKFNNRKNL